MSGLIRVAAQSRTSSVAGAIAGAMREDGEADVQAIGPGAVNQAMKAIAVARGFLHGEGMDIGVAPTMNDIDVNGAEMTAVRLAVFKR